MWDDLFGPVNMILGTLVSIALLPDCFVVQHILIVLYV